MFIEATKLRMPKATDLEMFDLLVNRVRNIEAYGFVLPDEMLLENAQSVLDGLAEETEVADTFYLQRPAGIPSLLEHAALQNRACGPVFWGQFLVGSWRGSVQRSWTN